MAYSKNNFGIPVNSATSVAKKGVNNTGSAIAMAIPVKLNSSGMSMIDPSVETDVDAIAGLTTEATIDGGSCEIAGGGSLENISTSFPLGSPVYVNTDGTLTNTKPSLGVGDWEVGDFVIRVGVVAQNADIPGQKDLIINIQIMGQL